MTLAIVDIDGTLVDSNYLHTVAWARALERNGLTVPSWKIHRHIGMGGDQIVSAIAGEEAENEHGDAVRDVHSKLYEEMLEEVQPLPGARHLLVELRERGHAVVLASSAEQDEAEHYVDLLDARELLVGWTTSADIESTKPEPDLIEAAREKAPDEDEAVMIGDTVWDIEAAKRADVPSIGVLCGGFARSELEDAGAEAVYETPAEIVEKMDETKLA